MKNARRDPPRRAFSIHLLLPALTRRPHSRGASRRSSSRGLGDPRTPLPAVACTLTRSPSVPQAQVAPPSKVAGHVWNVHRPVSQLSAMEVSPHFLGLLVAASASNSAPR